MTRLFARFPVIIGPTASGKTDLAIELAQAINGEWGPGTAQVVNADAYQVYKSMDIGTAKPSEEEMQTIQHHLISTVDCIEEYNVGTWQRQATNLIDSILQKGGIPIVCGGSHMYVNSLLHQSGLDAVPGKHDTIRAALELKTPKELYETLQKVDPISANKLHINDRKRVVRALEVFESSGKPMSSYQTQWTQPWRKDVVVVALEVEKEANNARINYRVDRMLENGLEKEVRALWEANAMSKNARAAIGYQHFCDWFENRKYTSLNEVTDRIKMDSRRYSKKQRTWIRRMSQHEGVLRFQLSAPRLSEWTSDQDISCLALHPPPSSHLITIMQILKTSVPGTTSVDTDIES